MSNLFSANDCYFLANCFVIIHYSIEIYYHECFAIVSKVNKTYCRLRGWHGVVVVLGKWRYLYDKFQRDIVKIYLTEFIYD